MIELISVTQPQHGAVIAFRCDQCKCTTFLLDEWATRPQDGDYWQWSMCADNPLHGVAWKFNTRLLPTLVSVQIFQPELVLPGVWRST